MCEINTTQIWLPLLLTVIAGISTGIGGLIAVSVRDFRKTYLTFSLGLSAGVMIYVSFAELLKTSIECIGSPMANLGFFCGIFAITLIDYIVPHEYIEEHIQIDKEPLLSHSDNGTHPDEIQPGYPRSSLQHNDEGISQRNRVKDRRILAAGVFTAIGIAIHNIPEGVAVFVSSLDNLKLGISVAFAVIIHNIPEGIAVAAPIFYATKSRKKAFLYSLLSGIAEPAGALLGLLILMPIINPITLHFSLAFVAGIMIFISFDELLPLSYENKENHIAVSGIILGMFIMALSLYLLS